jgi:hypothetical protein
MGGGMGGVQTPYPLKTREARNLLMFSSVTNILQTPQIRKRFQGTMTLDWPDNKYSQWT